MTRSLAVPGFVRGQLLKIGSLVVWQQHIVVHGCEAKQGMNDWGMYLI
jgi:hypothetical protein